MPGTKRSRTGAATAAPPSRKRRAPANRRAKKKRRTGASVSTRSNVSSTDTGCGGEFTKTSASYGRASKERLPLVVRANIERTSCRVTQVNQFDNPATASSLPGQIGLANWNANDTSQYTSLPMALIDVTSWFNYTGAPPYKYAKPLWLASASRLDGTIAWANAGNAWVLESADSTVGNGPTGAGDVLKWAQIKMLTYGRTAATTRFDVDLISLNRDYLHPEFMCPVDTTITLGAATVAMDANYAAEHNVFWQALVRPYLFSPLLTGNPKYNIGGKMKTHLHRSWTTQPSLTNEPSATQYAGHMHQFDLKLNLDRVQRYDWNASTYQITAASLEGTAQLTESFNDSTVVSPNKRMYLMIRAQSRLSTATTVDPSLHPSFDYVLRAMHEKL